MPSAYNSHTPTGAINSYGGPTAPSGWLVCDGSAVSRATYAALFAAVGTAFGSGDGSTTFALPDLRGRFLRGSDNMGTGAAGRDPDTGARTIMNTGGNAGNAVGSVQTNQVASHFHEVGYTNTNNAFGIGTTPLGGANFSFASVANSIAVRSNLQGGNETRPLNAYTNYIIKY